MQLQSKKYLGTEVYGPLSENLRKKDNIILFLNGRYHGKFEPVGDMWWLYNNPKAGEWSETQINDYITSFLNEKNKYKVGAESLGPTLAIYIKDIKNEMEKIKEITGTGAASGSYQTPFMKNEELVSVNEETLEALVKKVLLREFVYSSDAASMTNTNTKSKPTKSTAKQSIKAVEKNMEPNVKDEMPSSTKNINNTGRQNEKQQIEQEAGGLVDLEFDNASDEALKNFKDQLTAGDNAITDKKIGNASYDSTVGKDMLKRAKERNKSKKAAAVSTISLGSDIEVVGDQKNKIKKTMSENTENPFTHKKYILKNKSDYLTEAFLEAHLTKYENAYQGKNFFIEDLHGNRVKINWENKNPIVESIIDINKKAKYLSLREKLFECSQEDNDMNINEDNFFKKMFKQTKPYINED